MYYDRDIIRALHGAAASFHPVIEKKNNKVARVDLSSGNATLTPEVFNDPAALDEFIESQKKNLKAELLYGGYNEDRAMYRRSELFNDEEPRSLHLGIDIWGPAGTPIFNPTGGVVHSLGYNDNFGDYGATLIMQHQVESYNFYLLYGHISKKDIEILRVGQYLARGERLAHFGIPAENGHWPPHLHFQVILDVGNWEGDYPGVCKPSEANEYLLNSPDPGFFFRDLINNE